MDSHLKNRFRILATADWHLGRQQYGSFERVRDFASVVSQIAQIAKEEGVNLVGVAGDIFDSFTPGPFSQRAFRKFAEEMKAAGIFLACIPGNHEHDKRNSENREVARIDSLTDDLLRPSIDDPVVMKAPSVALVDWMPSNRLPSFLEALPKVDILVLHQSLEGLVPNVPQTELTQKQLLGRARLIIIGDTHVTKVLTLSDGTIVLSPGPTELNSSAEDRQKSVSIIDYDQEKHQVLEIRQVPLKTRRVLKPRVFDDNGLKVADVEVREFASENPLVLLEHNAAMRPLVEQKMAEWQALGLTLLFADPIVTIDKAESYVATRDSAEREMETILTNALEDPAEQAATGALWKTPGAAPEIIAELERSIRASHDL